MEKSYKTPVPILKAIFIIAFIIVAIRFFGFFIQSKYEYIISKEGLIETFYAGDALKLDQLRKTYHLEYIAYRQDKMIIKTNPSLPNVTSIIIKTDTNKKIVFSEYREMMKKILPQVSFNSKRFYIVFSFSFDSIDTRYIIFYNIFS